MERMCAAALRHFECLVFPAMLLLVPSGTAAALHRLNWDADCARPHRGEMAGITGVDHELNSALPIPPWTWAIPATFPKSLGVCVLRVNG